MRTLEYIALTLVVGALAYIGATMIGNALAASFNASAARIESAGR